MIRRAYAPLVALLLLGQGCTTPSSPKSLSAETPTSEAAPQPNKPEGKTVTNIPVIAPQLASPTPAAQASYRPFTQTAYEEARASHTPILLFFYASWCPYCRSQDPTIEQLFKNYPKNVQAFRVNYNDNNTDAQEKALASTFRIVTQHTLVFLDVTGTEVKRVIGDTSSANLKPLVDAIAP